MTSTLLKKNAIDLVVADASPLIAIAIMDLFPALNELFEQIIVPQAVVHECLHDLSKAQSNVIKQALKHKWIKEKTGRKVAIREGLVCIGSLYVLIKAKPILMLKK